MTTITVTSQEAVEVLARLRERLARPEGFLQAAGEDLVERSKQRFSSAKAPDGTPWAQNSEVTIRNYILGKGGFSKKTGKLLAKGEKLKASKRPLQGISGDLARQQHYQVDGEALSVGSSMVYAAMQHFGGTKAKFSHLWGDIPARPYLPVMPSGDKLYPSEEAAIVELLREYLVEE